jgi:hypothetical protein
MKIINKYKLQWLNMIINGMLSFVIMAAPINLRNCWSD